MLRSEAATFVIAFVAADIATRKPLAARVMVSPAAGLAPANTALVTTYWLVSPAKVITSPAPTVPVPPAARVSTFAPTA